MTPKRALTPGEIKALLYANGLTFGDCVAAFREDTPRNKIIEDLADSLTRDGEVEIDKPIITSEGDDNGTYVMAWVWVDFAGTELDKWNCECDNCGMRCAEEDLKPIEHLSMRVDPGGVVPAGECPDCGALSYRRDMKEEA